MTRPKRALAAALLALPVLCALLPVAITIATSFAAPDWVSAHHQGQDRAFWTRGMGWGWAQYQMLFSVHADVLHRLLISLAYAILATCLHLIVSFFAAFALAKVPMRGKAALFFGYVTAMLMPAQVLLLPSYIVLRALNLLGNWPGMLLVSVFAPFGVFFLRQALASLPNEIVEAGVMETSNPLALLRYVLVPCVSSSLIALGALTFAEAWNAVEQPMILLTQYDDMPIAVVIAYHIGNRQVESLFALCTLAIAPILALYAMSRKRIFAAMENMRF